MSHAVSVLPVPPPAPTALTAHEVKAQVHLIQEVMQGVMREGFHYGVLPGTDKPTLLKPGAEKLTMTFRLAPVLTVEMTDLDDGHREYRVQCALRHINTGQLWGEGIGMCSTMESKYRYRQAERTCPHCGNASIIKGRAEYGGGWLCFQKKGGCGAKFGEMDTAITSQGVGRVENPDLPDVYNTVLKMAKKRALVDAALTATAASDCFNQDLEDFLPAESSLPPAVETTAKPLTMRPKPEGTTGLISDGQRKRLFAMANEQKIGTPDLKRFLTEVHQITSVNDIPTGTYEVICESITDGSVKEFLKMGASPEQAG